MKEIGLLYAHTPKQVRKSRWRTLLAACWWILSWPLALQAEQAEDWRLGLPAIAPTPHSETSPAQIKLGQMLFFDKRLSGDGSISCASCHQPERAFTDGRELARGIGGQIGTRNTPSLINAAFNTSQFWDGRRPSFEAQAIDPFVNAREHGLKDQNALLNLLRGDRHYAGAFRNAFQAAPDAIDVTLVGKALASFERTLIAGDSPFDRYYFKGQKSQLSASAERGLALFQGSARCATCHTIGNTHALFTDNQFHSLNVGSKRIEQRLPEVTTRLVEARRREIALDQTILTDDDIAELGRFAVTLNPVDIGKFRTPSLRNVALTAPYMHDGSVATLEKAVELEIYYRSAETGRPLILTPLEKSDLVAFLKSLSSPMANRFVAPP